VRETVVCANGCRRLPRIEASVTKLVHEVIVGEGNDDDIQSIAHLEFMLEKRCFTVNQMPPEAVTLWRVSYLLAEILNGGLAHYISNTGWSPAAIRGTRAALDHYFERATAPDCFC
jgi:hypothetical protein